MSNDWTSTSRSQFFWASFFFGIFKFIFGLILEFFIFSNLKRNIFKDLHALHTFRLVLLKIEEPLDVVLIYPWSAHDQPVIYRAPCKIRQKICTCEFFSIFQKSRKIAENAKKQWFFVSFFVNKNRVFLEAKFPKMHYKNHHFLDDKCSTFSLKNRT